MKRRHASFCHVCYHSMLFIPSEGKMAQILCMPANSAFEAT